MHCQPALQVTSLEDVILDQVLIQGAKGWGPGGNSPGGKSAVTIPYAHVNYKSNINRKAQPHSAMLYTRVRVVPKVSEIALV